MPSSVLFVASHWVGLIESRYFFHVTSFYFGYLLSLIYRSRWVFCCYYETLLITCLEIQRPSKVAVLNKFRLQKWNY